MDIMKLAQEQEEYIIAQRRDFHRHPEISDHEERTVQRICEELTAMGIQPIDVPHGGVLAFLGKRDGKSILLRADIDALPMPEAPDNLKGPKVCVSENEGVCHACGHDGHTAMLLGAAKILKDHEDELPGQVILMFERGEEGTQNCVYLHRYLKEQGIRVDTSWGMHLMSYLPSGQISMAPGPELAGVLGFTITIQGKGGHGSRPDQSVSPIDCFVAIYNAMNTIRMRKISPFDVLTFSVGTLHAGSADNIIPEELTFSGTVRIFEHADGVTFKTTFQQMLDHICEAYDCECIIDNLSGPGFGVVNDAACAVLAEQSIGAVIGPDRIVRSEPQMGSESFALTMAIYPGVFGMLGIANPEVGSGANHHNGAFDLDENVLKYGVAAHVAYALAFLSGEVMPATEPWNDTLFKLYHSAGSRDEILAVAEGL